MADADEKKYDIEDPFVGSDPLEDDGDEAVDYGNDLEPAEDSEPAKTTPEPEPDTESESKPEPEAEAEPETKPESEPDTKTDTEPEKQEQRIPKQRFDEINERRKLAEKKLADFEAQQAAAQEASQGEFDFDSKEQEYMEAVVDGEFDKAKLLRQEIRAAELANVEVIARRQAENATVQTKASIEFDATVEELARDFDTFNPDTDSYDQLLVDEVLEIHEGFVNKGHAPAAALRKAVRYVAAANGLQPNSAAAKTTADPEPATPQVTEKPVTKQEVRKKVQTRSQQPPDMPANAAAEPSFDITSLSEDEYDALPESKIRELRGDFT